jgi:hypothetical protein
LKLPNFEHAVVEVTKLRDYSLDPLHDVGKHKARVFQAVLGITIDDAEWLREKLLRAAHEEEAVAAPPSIFGEKYIIDTLIMRGERKAVVRAAWIIEYGTDFPRLTSCYVLRKGDSDARDQRK